MKKFLTIFFSCFCFISAFGQYNYYKFSAGLNVGVNQAYSDIEKTRIKQTIAPSIEYNITPFSSLGLELQIGSLSAGDSITDPHKRFFNNSYKAAIMQGKVQLGQFVDFESSNFLYAIRGFYIGTGVGVISNSMKDIVRKQPGTGHVFPGVDKSTNLMVPVNTGININVLDRWGYTRYIFSLNYQMNVTFGEGLDGYNDSSVKFKNSYPDFYSFTSVGVKVCFGPEGIY